MRAKLGHAVLFLALIVGGWLAPAPAEGASVKSVQSSTTSISGPSNTVTVTITAVATSKSFLIFNTRHNSNRPVASMVRGRIATATSLEFVKVSNEAAGAGVINIQWYVVEFEGGVRVQRGALTQSATPMNFTLPTAVASLSQAFVTQSKTPASGDGSWSWDDPIVCELTTTSNLQCRVSGANASHTIWWEVIEFTDPAAINVQKSTTSLTAGALSTTVTLGTAVDVSKTFVLASYRVNTAAGGDASGADVGARMLRAQLTNSTTITFDRDIAGGDDNLSEIVWQAVELKDGSSVQRGSANFASGVPQTPVSITSVDTSRSIAFASVQPVGGQNMGKSPYAGDDIIGVGSVTMALAATQITMDRSNTAAAADVGWFVVQFFKCAAVADAGYVAANAQSTQATGYWSSSNAVLILRQAGAAFGSERPENGKSYSVGATGGELGTATVVDNDTAAKASFTQTALTNGTTYYYKVFPKTGTGGASCYAPGIEVNAKPQAAPPAWSYMMASGSMLKPGIAGSATIHTSSNASRIVSLGTGNGTQSWAPLGTNAAVQGWLTWLPVQGYLYRRNLPITAGTAAVPSGYTVALTFDHASLVAAGKSLASGDDVRVFYWDGAGWVQLDRVLENGSSWNTASTTIWFKTQAAIGASATDSNHYLFYGNSSAANPPANKANVFLFFDDFEAGNLSKWTILSGLWAVATDQPRSGTYSLKYPAEVATDRHIVANPALDEANVYFDAWWRFGDVASMDIAQIFRRQSAATSSYETNLEGTAGWDIAKQISGTWTELNPNAGTPAANTWTRIGIAIYGTGMRVFKDGVQINPATGSFNVGTELASGNIGFRKWQVGTGFAWWIDDVIVRRYVDPEPTAALAAEEALSGAIVIGGDQSGRVYSVDTATGLKNWEVTLTGADAVQAGVSAQVRTWSNAAFQAAYTTDVVFAATRSSTLTHCGVATTNNQVAAIRASDGVVLWTFNGTCTDGSVDIISGQPWVDYGRNRLYVTSRAAGGAQPSLWVINTLNGALVASFALVDVDTSPTMSFTSGALYVGNTSGLLYAIDLNTLALKWSSPFVIGSAVNGFVWEDAATPGRLYMTTADGNVRCVQDNGTSASACSGWTLSNVPGASTPLVLDKLFVGSSDGKVHQINLTTGVNEKQFPAAGTLDGTTVGDVSTETGNEIFVGTNGGKIFKIDLVGGALP